MEGIKGSGQDESLPLCKSPKSNEGWMRLQLLARPTGIASKLKAQKSMYQVSSTWGSRRTQQLHWKKCGIPARVARK